MPPQSYNSYQDLLSILLSVSTSSATISLVSTTFRTHCEILQRIGATKVCKPTTNDSTQIQSEDIVPVTESPSKPPALPLLQTLPNELMLLIMSHMSSPSIVALSHTCSKFYRISTKVVENIFDRYPYPNENLGRLLDQVEFLWLLNRNKEILKTKRPSRPGLLQLTRAPQLQHECVTCKKHYGASFFSLPALRGPVETRECFYHESRLWICPSHVWTYEKVKDLCRGRGYDHTSLQKCSGLCSCRKHFLWFQRTAVVQAIPLFASYRHSTGKFSHLAPSSEFRICPHMNHADADVRQRLPIGCRRGFNHPRRSCICRMCSSNRKGRVGQCPSCLTSYQFRTREFVDGAGQGKLDYLLTRRAFCYPTERWRQGCKSKKFWLGHVSLPSEYPGLEMEWNFEWKTDEETYTFPQWLFEEDPFANGFCW